MWIVSYKLAISPEKSSYQSLFHQIVFYVNSYFHLFLNLLWFSCSINIDTKIGQSPYILCQLISLSFPTRDPTLRPTFRELLDKLRELQKRYAIQFQAARSAGGESTQKES